MVANLAGAMEWDEEVIGDAGSGISSAH